MQDTRLKYLYQQYFEHQATKAEREEFLAYLEDTSNKEEIEEIMSTHWDGFVPSEPVFSAVQREQMLAAVLEDERKTVKLWPRIAIAAAIAVVVFGAGLFYYNLNFNQHKSEQVAHQNDVAPGKNGATLTLASGKVIQLSDEKKGVVIAQDLKYDDGSLVANATSRDLSYGRDDVLGNKMKVSTAKGQTYQITLPDGTKVWLNAASSLTYTMPLKERGGIRKVELSGEAYFEVFKNKLQPFVVNSKKMELTVLGTHFNVNAYKDEVGVRTTLLEGSVRLKNELASTRSAPRNDGPAHGEVVLKPNQQALNDGETIKVKDIDVNEAIDWKNGDFAFNGELLESVMRKVARWYDVDISYGEDAPKDLRLFGYVSRKRNISAVLEHLERTGSLHFKIEGKTVHVGK